MIGKKPDPSTKGRKDDRLVHRYVLKGRVPTRAKKNRRVKEFSMTQKPRIKSQT